MGKYVHMCNFMNTKIYHHGNCVQRYTIVTVIVNYDSETIINVLFIFYTVLETSFPPIIINQPTARTARFFDKVTLTCSADGNPDPVIRWYKDGVALEGPQSVGGVYTIDEVKSEDRGTYHCQATNTRGNVTSNKATVMIEGDYIYIMKALLCY